MSRRAVPLLGLVLALGAAGTALWLAGGGDGTPAGGVPLVADGVATPSDDAGGSGRARSSTSTSTSTSTGTTTGASSTPSTSTGVGGAREAAGAGTASAPTGTASGQGPTADGERAAAAGRAAPPASGPAGSVRGRVLRESDGLAVVGATVRVFRDGQAPDKSPHAARSGEDGAFAVEGIAPGRYALEARAEEWAPEVVAGIRVEGAAATDVGEVRLSAGATVHGHVIGGDGLARAGLTVRAAGLMHVPREAVSDPAGEWRIAGLAPGTYLVEVRNATDTTFPVVVVGLRAGETRQLEFGPAAGVRLTATVLRDGSAVEGAEVRFVSRGSAASEAGLAVSDLRTEAKRTDASGRVTFPDLVPGPYDVIAVARDRDPAGKEFGPPRVALASVVLPPEGDAQAVTLAFAGGALAGTVVDAVTGGPLDGVRITVEPAGLRATRSLADWFVHLFATHTGSDREGRFALAHVAPGEYSVACVKDGYTSAVLESVVVDAHGSPPLRVALVPGGGGTIAGKVTLGTERAVQGVFVLLRDPFGAEVGFAGVSIDGTFKFPGLRPGAHTLLCYVPTRPVEIRDACVVRPGETTEVALDLPALQAATPAGR